MNLSKLSFIRTVFLCIGLLIATVFSLDAETQYFRYTSNTGSNATIIIPITVEPIVDGEPLVNGDEIGVFTEDGLCVGAVVWSELQQSITVWGNNEQTTEKDGMEHNDSLYYRVWRQATGIEYRNIKVTYDDSQPFYRTDGRYRNNAIYMLTSFQSFPAPSPPELIMPEDETEHLPTTVEFQWRETELTDSYTLQIATDAGFSDPVVNREGITSTSYEVTGLDYGTTYYWRVSGANLAGQGEWSEVRQFSTLPVPPTPMLVSPEDNAGDLLTEITFEWEETELTDSYRLQIATDANFSNLAINQEGITSTSYEVTGLQYESIYYWRVRAANIAGEGEWSEVRRFSTLFAPPAPILISPENDAEDIPVTAEFHWEETARADTYRLQIATNTNFTNIVVDEEDITSSSYEVSNLDYEFTYFWRVAGINLAGQGPWSDVWQFATPDRFIQFINPAGSTVWKENSIERIEWQTMGVEEMRIDYSTNNGATWIVIEESINTALDGFDWTVPATPSTQTLLRLTDLQDENLSTISPVLSIYPEVISMERSIPFDDPSLVSSYRMVGLPGNNNIPVAAIMNGKARSDWTAFWDDGSDENYLIEYTESDMFTFTPGRGFWVLSKNGINIDTTAHTVELGTLHVYDIPIHNGWNIISNPFGVSIPWADVQTYNDIINPIWSYNGSFNQSTAFEPFAGYYYYNEENHTSLSIPYPNSGSITEPAKVTPEITRYLTFTIEKEGIPRSDIFIGITEMYDESLERYNIQAPPTDFEEASIRMQNDRVHTQLLSPYSEGYTIDIQIKTPKNKQYTIHIEGTETFSDYHLVLVNTHTGKRIELNDINTFDISSSSGAEHFKLILGSEEYTREVQNNMLPSVLTLAQNYPNPFNPVTTIEYGIPIEKDNVFVTLEIFNLLGQKVRTLVKDRQSAGFYSVEWDARNDGSTTVPSGLYIYRLNAGATMLSNTMILLK